MECKDADVKELIGKQRFKFLKVLANTLQGRIYLAQDRTGKNQWVVVKETWKELVKQGKSRDGHKVPENFEREKKIHLFLSKLPDQNEGYVRCIEDWEDDNCYYLAMDYCGAGELFDFIRDNHTKEELSDLVKKAATQEQKCQVKSNEWSLCVQSMFRQMVDTVSWMHVHGVAHLDLSLENTMLASADKSKPLIKIIDFGLAQHFTGNQKFQEKVGKVGYMAPEVYARKEYSPEKADIWCLAVMLFMMLVGAPPYEFPSPANPAYRFIIGGRLRDVLAHWKRLPLVSADALDVMEKIFKLENERMNMEELRKHKYVDLPPISHQAELATSTVTVDTKDKELKDQKKLAEKLTNGQNHTLTIKNEAIPFFETKKAQEMAQQLRQTVGVENMRIIAQIIERNIEKINSKSQSNSKDGEHVKADGENPSAEGVSVEENNYDPNKCVSELKKLLQLANEAIAVNTT